MDSEVGKKRDLNLEEWKVEPLKNFKKAFGKGGAEFSIMADYRE